MGCFSMIEDRWVGWVGMGGGFGLWRCWEGWLGVVVFVVVVLVSCLLGAVGRHRISTGVLKREKGGEEAGS